MPTALTKGPARTVLPGRHCRVSYRAEQRGVGRCLLAELLSASCESTGTIEWAYRAHLEELFVLACPFCQVQVTMVQRGLHIKLVRQLQQDAMCQPQMPRFYVRWACRDTGSAACHRLHTPPRLEHPRELG